MTAAQDSFSHANALARSVGDRTLPTDEWVLETMDQVADSGILTSSRISCTGVKGPSSARTFASGVNRHVSSLPWGSANWVQSRDVNRSAGDPVLGRLDRVSVKAAIQPTAPSICSSIRRLSSRAYSMGSSRAMGSTKPRTTVAMASSSDMPRLIR